SAQACSDVSATRGRRSVVQDRALAHERRVDDVLPHEVGHVGARDLRVDGRVQFAAEPVNAGVRSVRQPGWADVDPVEITVADQRVLVFLVAKGVSVEYA